MCITDRPRKELLQVPTSSKAKCTNEILTYTRIYNQLARDGGETKRNLEAD